VCGFYVSLNICFCVYTCYFIWKCTVSFFALIKVVKWSVCLGFTASGFTIIFILLIGVILFYNNKNA
jgi:hypothetical protein